MSPSIQRVEPAKGLNRRLPAGAEGTPSPYRAAAAALMCSRIVNRLWSTETHEGLFEAYEGLFAEGMSVSHPAQIHARWYNLGLDRYAHVVGLER